MNIQRADILGYCMGVRRAVEKAELAVTEHPGKSVYTIGPLIHNNSALEALIKKGIQILPEDGGKLPENPENSVVIIRAHGVPPEIISSLKEDGCTVIDATCPRVLSSQKSAADMSKKGCTVLLAGDKNHGEVVGISGYAKANGAECIVIENRYDAELVPPLNKKAVLISQTTISREEYTAIADVLKAKIPDLIVYNTICPATQERQNALIALCKTVEGVLVIGGKHSANTKRLLRTAQELCSNAALIETASEIPIEFYKLQKVGITAGASTPDFIIDEVEEVLENNGLLSKANTE